MEFKVWVDGIQRVVCGVNYSTTCQEVVLALASAMGRTGHFTLVERWRDSERSLISAECPLKSLQKRGEYAGEVKYYLIQAETDRVKHQEQNNHNTNMPAHQKYTFLHSPIITPPETLQYHHQCSLKPELVKRSSTFSGAHKSAHETLPSSLSKSSTSVSPSNHNCNKQTLVASPTTCTARRHLLGFTPASRGKITDISPTSISNSSSRPLSRSVKDIPESHTPKETSPDLIMHPLVTFSADVRGFNPVIMPEALSAHYSPSSSHTHFSLVPSQQSASPHSQQSASPHSQQLVFTHSQQSASPHSQQLVSTHQMQHLNLRQTFQPLTSSSKSNCSPTCGNYPAAMTSVPHTQLPTSELLFLKSKQLNQHTCPTPTSRHKKVPSSTTLDQERVQSQIQYGSKSPQQIKKLHDKNVQSVPDSFPNNAGGCVRSFSDEITEDINQNVGRINASHNYHTQSGQDGSVLHSDLEAMKGYQHFSNNRIPRNLNNCDKNIQRKLISKDISKFPNESKEYLFMSATLDRPFIRPKPGLYKSENEQIMSEEFIKQEPPSDNDQFQHNKEDKKLKLVNPAFTKQQKIDTNGNNNNTTVSIFASAVAHIRQCSEDILFKHSKTGTHVRQHSSDSSKTDASFKEGLTLITSKLMGQEKNCTNNFKNSGKIYSNNQQCRDHLSQQLNKSSISSPCYNSAFTEIFTKPSYQEICNTNSTNGKLRDFGCLFGNVISSLSYKESSHSRHVSLDIDGCNLDKNFPNALQRDITGSGRAKGGQQSGMLDENGLNIDITTSQTENEYCHLLQKVKMQQEKIKLQKANIMEADLEITTFEDKESRVKAKLDSILQEVFTFEVYEINFKTELEHLDMTEWTDVLHKEKKLEAILKLQIGSLKEKLEQMESKIQKVKEEENLKSKELKSEEERKLIEKKENELQKAIILEMKHLEDQLASLSVITDQNNQKMKEVEREILSQDTHLDQKERDIKIMEEELNAEAKKLSSTSVHSIIPILPSSKTALPILTNGEAILKILDSRLSHSSPKSHTRYEADNMGDITSAQHLYHSAVAVKNFTGIWV